jgi:hypothetical protein
LATDKRCRVADGSFEQHTPGKKMNQEKSPFDSEDIDAFVKRILVLPKARITAELAKMIAAGPKRAKKKPTRHPLGDRDVTVH